MYRSDPGCAKPPRYIYVPMPKYVPVTMPSPALVAATPAPTRAAIPVSTSMSNSLTLILSRVSRDLEHEGWVERPRRIRVETRAMYDASPEYVHRHGSLLDHATMVSMLAKGE